MSHEVAVQRVPLLQVARIACFLIAACTIAIPLKAQAPCPATPVVQVSSAAIPQDVCIPAGFGGNPIAFFDDYSWKAFIAVVWPVRPGARGVPDTAHKVSDPGTRVFETFKALWETFHADGSPPQRWNAQDGMNPCASTLGFDDMVLASFTKFSDLGQAGFGTLIGPLVAQNTTYVRYLTTFNEVEFDQIVAQKLFIRNNLPAAPNSLVLPNGSLDVKSAWIIMDGIPHPERYYTRAALVLDPQTGECSRRTVGLVGLHIVQKTPSRPQWIWSTFEQVDTVPRAQQPGTSFSFNDGKGTPMPSANPYSISPLTLPTPPPFNVQRLKPIHSSTENTNTAYENALAQQGAVWQFYRLVMTQWPLQASQPALPGTPGNTFPGSGSDSTSFANTTLETFEQGNIRTGCMNCHTQTMRATDFVWSLQDHAFPPAVPSLLFKTSSLRDLRSLMEIGVPARQEKTTH